MPDIVHDFEFFLRFELPWMLNLSPSKQVATEINFTHFADFTDSLTKKAPKEFEFFFKEFRENLGKIAKWRVHKEFKIIPIYYDGKFKYYPNGKLQYRLAEKPNPKVEQSSLRGRQKVEEMIEKWRL